jgi:hypothetical protein
MRVVDWLPTRTFELVVHGLDISAATGIAFQPSDVALADATLLAARLAVAVGDGVVVVLRALSGRLKPPEWKGSLMRGPRLEDSHV